MTTLDYSVSEVRSIDKIPRWYQANPASPPKKTGIPETRYSEYSDLRAPRGHEYRVRNLRAVKSACRAYRLH